MPHIDHYRNGVKLVSVTELQKIISKPYLETWKESLCQKGLVCGFDAAKAIAEEASELGNKVHEDMEAWFRGVAPVTDWGKKIAAHFTEAHVQAAFIAPEESLIDTESGLAGSPDAVIRGIWKDYRGYAISDYKIKNQLDMLTGMQGAGYRYLLRCKYNVDINKMLVMWCQKKTVGLKVKPVWIDLNEWTEPFKHLVAMWNVLNPKRRVVIHE